jgi:hydroxyacylglutathione hydrolase
VPEGPFPPWPGTADDVFLQTIPVGVFRCNCAIVACERTRQALVIDPGDRPEQILDIIRAHALEVAFVLQTHGHIDHIMGSYAIVEATGAVVRLHRADRRLFQRVGAVAESLRIPPPRVPPLGPALEDGERLTFGDEEVRVIHTPGHTPGSCCFAIEPAGGRPVLFSGDTLFRATIGLPNPATRRTRETILASIRERVLTLDDATRVIPGHGPETDIRTERYENALLASM